MTDVQAPVWFITGCSTGFGRELAKLTIERGWPTVVTARGRDRVADLAGGKDHVLALDLDVTDMKQISDAVSAAEQKFGRIDVLVNNAGYGYQASIEEGEEDEIRAMFDANVFGLFAMTRAVLPGMRAKRKGDILNITSMAGFMGLPSSGYYAASKHAVEGFSDALAMEGAPLGIRVTCVEPGPFRTDWAGRSLRQTPSTIADYAETASARMGATSGYSGRQPGDPVRAGEAMIAATEADRAPRHLVLGAIAYKAVTQKLNERLAQIELWEDISLSADFPS
ncbi:SDR family NAD(P)-dependent oxidoreductase [Neorhizobium galegae]|uniref:SDR family NAD(P)-dependent oxidoreductase n=1 Tax=Neorhizobium galegae TaxID=399 RepID=A0A6A1TIB8_NEOGA|nr:oxidoreductase [Neorhizobium galegae]KAB1083634.1 SDR family NAD(P)-dependent oxidoreductase [Neorhizobium galegae]